MGDLCERCTVSKNKALTYCVKFSEQETQYMKSYNSIFIFCRVHNKESNLSKHSMNSDI